MTADISCSQLGVWFLAENPCGGQTLAASWLTVRGECWRCVGYTQYVCLHTCSYMHIEIYRMCVCVCIRSEVGVWLSPPVVQGLKTKMINMQPTPSATFSRMLESDSASVCFSVWHVHVLVWVCMLPRGLHISLYEMLHSLAPSMGRKR